MGPTHKGHPCPPGPPETAGRCRCRAPGTGTAPTAAPWPGRPPRRRGWVEADREAGLPHQPPPLQAVKHSPICLVEICFNYQLFMACTLCTWGKKNATLVSDVDVQGMCSININCPSNNHQFLEISIAFDGYRLHASDPGDSYRGGSELGQQLVRDGWQRPQGMEADCPVCCVWTGGGIGSKDGCRMEWAGLAQGGEVDLYQAFA